MKIFVLEDDPNRINWFTRAFYDCELITVAATAEKGKYYIRNYKYDLIFLDHDLGNRQFVPSNDPITGYQVAKEIPNSINKNTPIVIHSYNPAGVANMQAILPKAVAMPYGTFSRTTFSEK